MKKAVAFLLALTLVISCMAFALADDKPYAGVSLTMCQAPFTGDDLTYWAETMAKFEEETGIKVETSVFDWDNVEAKYLTAFMGGEGPDVFYTTKEISYSLNEAGALLDLTPYFSEEEKAEQLYWDNAYALGAQIAAPYASGMNFRGYVYNMDYLAKVGITSENQLPETREELIELCEKIKDADICEYPILYSCGGGAGEACATLYPALWSAGADVMNEAGDAVTLNTPEALGTLQFFYDLMHKYEVLSEDSISMTCSDVVNLFNEGKVAVAAIGFDDLFTNTDKDFEYEISYGVSDGAHEVKCFSPLDTISVNPNSKNVDASIVLLKWLLTDEARQSFRENLYGGLKRMNASEGACSTGCEKLDAVIDLGSHAHPFAATKNCDAMRSQIWSIFQMMLMDEYSPDEALQEMQTICEELYNQ